MSHSNARLPESSLSRTYGTWLIVAPSLGRLLRLGPAVLVGSRKDPALHHAARDSTIAKAENGRATRQVLQEYTP